jgi:anti-sigma regulatory factor (Ser/Thr protein kinase)
MKRAWWAQSPTATIWETTLARGHGAPSEARHELAGHLDGTLDADRTRELLLLAGELVSNSVLHARADGDPEILVELIVGRDAVRVVVTDGGSATVPAVQPRDPLGAGGRGLYLVESLSDSWGMERDGARQTRVWFEMRREPSAVGRSLSW